MDTDLYDGDYETLLITAQLKTLLTGETIQGFTVVFDNDEKYELSEKETEDLYEIKDILKTLVEELTYICLKRIQENTLKKIRTLEDFVSLELAECREQIIQNLMFLENALEQE